MTSNITRAFLTVLPVSVGDVSKQNHVTSAQAMSRAEPIEMGQVPVHDRRWMTRFPLRVRSPFLVTMAVVEVPVAAVEVMEEAAGDPEEEVMEEDMENPVGSREEESQAEADRPKVEPMMVALPDSNVLRFLSRIRTQSRRAQINKATTTIPTLTTMVRQVPEALCRLASDFPAPGIPVGFKM